MRIYSLLIACALTFVTLTGAISEERPIVLGALFGLTGDSAQFGKGELDAATLAIEEWNDRGGINKRKIELEAEDTQSNQTKVLLGLEKLTSVSGHRFLLGPTWLDTYQAALVAAEKKKVLLLTPSAESRALTHADQRDPWGFTCYFSSTAEVHALLTTLYSSGVRTLIGTYTREPFFQLMRKMVEEEAPKIGITVLGSYEYDMAFADFRSEMPKFKSKSPDALLLFQTSERSILNFLRSRVQMFPQVKIAGIHDFKGFIQNPEVKSLAEGIYFPDFELADKSFATKFKQRFGYEPILTHSNAYDATNIILEGIAAGADEGLSMKKFLLSRSFSTVTFGETKFSPQGVIQGSKVGVFRLIEGVQKKVAS